tara:strand:+ start:198 stop:1463 length:1266 start_codon:yes stop_codon:yes gene_type:complete
MSEIEKLENIQIHEVRVAKKIVRGAKNSYGPIYPNVEKYNHLMQFQEGDKLSAQQPKADNSNDLETIDIPLFWCGRSPEHYGAFIAKHISRIIVYKDFEIKGKLCFSVRPNQGANVKSWFWKILDHFGYSKEDVFFVDKPIIAKTLYVTPQNEMIYQKSNTSENYLNLLDKNYPPKPLSEKKGIVYISRSKLPTTNCLLGEDYLEFYFKKCGIKIVHPEQISIIEQLEIYNSARCIIMLEGSAYHTFQLFGRALGDVIIIARRTTTKKSDHGEHWCQSFIEPRCNSLTFYSGYNEDGVENYLKKINQKKKTISKSGGAPRIYNYTKMMKEIMNVVKSIDESILDVEISKSEYTKFMQNDYIKFLKNEAEIINRLEKKEIVQEVKNINKSMPNFKMWEFKSMEYDDYIKFIKSEVNKINNVS